MLRVTTESGSVYDFSDKYVRRAGSHDLRQDNQWVELVGPPEIVEGFPMMLMLSPLDPKATFTLRATTPVISIEEVSNVLPV